MARMIKRHGSARKKLCRRSRESRRLSEGGGWVAPPSTTGPGPEALPPQQQHPQVDTGKLTEDEIDTACMFVFNFDEMRKDLMIRDAILRVDLDGLCETKAMYDEKIANLKKTTKSQDSQNIKQIKFASRESYELEELINDCNMELQEVSFLKTKAEAIFRSDVAVLSHYAAQEEEGSMIGYLARIMMME